MPTNKTESTRYQPLCTSTLQENMAMSTRRKFIQTLSTVPLIAAVGTSNASAKEPGDDSGFGHKLKISLQVFSFNDLLRNGTIDLLEVVDFAAKHNFDAIDPTGYYFPGYPNVPTDDYINEFKRKTFQLGLDISGTGIRNDFANPDQASRKADIELIKQWVVATAKLGIPHLRIFSGRNEHKGFSRDQVYEWMAKDIRECCDFGKKYGVMITLQNHNEFFKTATEVDRLFEMVDSEWFGLNLDVASYREKDPYQEIEQSIPRAVTWQIKDHVYIDGEQTPTDYLKLFKLMKKSGYRGYLPLETLRADPYERVPVMLASVRAALKQI